MVLAGYTADALKKSTLFIVSVARIVGSGWADYVAYVGERL